jgi:cytochrome c-type biogenesis protein CcmH
MYGLKAVRFKTLSFGDRTRFLVGLRRFRFLFEVRRSRFPVERFGLGLVVAVLVCFSVGATDPAGRFEDLGHKMMCQCSCGQVMLECNHVGCPVSPVMRKELSAGIASGVSDSLILQSFVQRYGAVVLAAPTTEGFDLVAWIMPFAVAAFGLIGTIFLVRHWSKKQAELAIPARSLGSEATRAEMRERIRRETE